MKPPIFLSTPGNLDIFRSVEDAAAYLEPEDIPITNLFDCEGTRLTAVHASPTSFARAWNLPGRKILIHEEEAAPREPERLRELIMDFLTCLKHPGEEVATADLPRLVALCAPYLSRG